MKSGSPDGNMVADMIKDGQIVPSHVTISLLQKAMADSGQDRFLIDGFPRNDENRNAFEQQVCSSSFLAPDPLCRPCHLRSLLATKATG